MVKTVSLIIVLSVFSGSSGMEEVDVSEFSPYYSPESGMTAQPTEEENHFSYGECPKVTQLLDKDFYKQVVAQLPILCIDTFLVNPKSKKYLLVKRCNNPAKGTYWLPGGRMIKGESFFEGAQRKCSEEIGISIEAKQVLGIYNVLFPDSEWGTPTHTPGIGVLATCSSEESVSLNELHEDHKWVSLSEPNTIDYIDKMRKKALKVLMRASINDENI